MSEKSRKVSLFHWEQIKEKFNYRCAYCGKKEYLTMDHYIPISKGGKTTKDNIVPACIGCNNKKSNKKWIIYDP